MLCLHVLFQCSVCCLLEIEIMALTRHDLRAKLARRRHDLNFKLRPTCTSALHANASSRLCVTMRSRYALAC